MIRIPICPACAEPVADQPAQGWTGAYRSRDWWWHLTDNTPICFDTNGRRSQAVFVEDGLPADSQSNAWLDAMSELSTIGGPYDPARLGGAVTAAEHLHRWLHTATGPFSALTALPAPADVAFLVGHLHRTNRLLARIHAQVGAYVLDQARQPQFTGLTDDSDLHDEVIDTADDIHECLQDAADACAQAAQTVGAAWSDTRKLTTLTATEHGRQAYHDTLATDTGHEPTSAQVAPELFDTHEPSPGRLAELIGAAFGDEAGFSPELTHTAARILGTAASYLADCLGPARPAAIPTPHDLADLTTSLTYLTRTLLGGLRRLADSPRGSESDGLDDADASAIRASLTDAADALRSAASHLATVSHTAAPGQRDEEQR
ncbi:hypothetical protein O7606_20400 [Micromonospora sp. WMMD882]|uniref:hypothetical protein n=1 Tax=Micromonospora sp. WMMD882 TaxID=3015151 RepID=UPI00248AB47C|nr:hypothetical protein [Micromonospora sp. WMMD882]WBB78564.1 hypothetical protein O7606_20400 [Micromonospora sp. WMMD882]